MVYWKKQQKKTGNALPPPMTKHSSSKKRSSNPYSGRGLERLAMVCAEFEARKRDQYLQHMKEGHHSLMSGAAAILLVDGQRPSIERPNLIVANPKSSDHPNSSPNPTPNPGLCANANPNPRPKSTCHSPNRDPIPDDPHVKKGLMLKLLHSLTSKAHASKIPSNDSINIHQHAADPSMSPDDRNRHDPSHMQLDAPRKLGDLSSQTRPAKLQSPKKINDKNTKGKALRRSKIKWSYPCPNSSKQPNKPSSSSSSSSSHHEHGNMVMNESVSSQDLMEVEDPSTPNPRSRVDSTVSRDKEKVEEILGAIGVVLGLSGLVTGYVIAILGVVCWWYVLPALRNAFGYKPVVNLHRNHKEHYIRKG